MTDLFEYMTYIKADETIDRDKAISLAQARAVDSGWEVERIVSLSDATLSGATAEPLGYHVTLLVHREK